MMPASIVKGRAKYNHAVRLYEAMVQAAISVDGWLVGSGDLTYEGHITKLYTSLDIPQTYYVDIVRKLEDVGCITKLRRGSRGIPSQYALHVHPDDVPWDDVDPRKSLTTLDDLATLGQQVRDIQSQLQGLDLGALFLDFDKRLRKLEERT